MYVNGLFSGGNTGTENFTAYISPYLVVSKGGNYTKHIYIGSQRVVSKLGDLSSYGPDPRRVEYAGANITGTKVDYKAKYAALQQVIKDRYAKFEVPYYGKDNDDYVNGQGFCCNDAPGLRSFGSGQNDNPELFQYYYHSDHLGSTGLITNLDGETVQHVEYVPFGEVFIEERNNTWNTPYLFNAKELDEEIGLYYYGARYYDPRVSVWYGTDPNQEKYPNFSTFTYCFNNPVLFMDMDGRDGWKRFWGALQMVGGAVEAVVGGVGGVLTAETGVGAVVGYAVLANGIDNTVTGAKQLWTGESQNTLLHTSVKEGSKALGASESTANTIANVVDLSTIALGGGANSIKAANTFLRAGSKFNVASEFGFKSYKALKADVVAKYGKNSGYQVHHLIEQRFADLFNTKTDDMLSMVLTAEEHTKFTNAWRKEIGYITDKVAKTTGNVSKQDVVNAAKNVYKDAPEILKALGIN